MSSELGRPDDGTDPTGFLNVEFYVALKPYSQWTGAYRTKAALIEAPDLQANTIKVVTESGTVFLMGLVSQREAGRAAQVASRVSGVQRVVTVFELISEEEVSAAKQRTQSQ